MKVIIIKFINYMSEKNDFLGETNFIVWLVIISALIVTALNKIDEIKK